jgi:hypothetical protein
MYVALPTTGPPRWNCSFRAGRHPYGQKNRTDVCSRKGVVSEPNAGENLGRADCSEIVSWPALAQGIRRCAQSERMGCEGIGRQSGSLPVVILQDAAQTLATLNLAAGAADLLARLDEAVVQTLMISLCVKMGNPVWSKNSDKLLDRGTSGKLLTVGTIFRPRHGVTISGQREVCGVMLLYVAIGRTRNAADAKRAGTDFEHRRQAAWR